MKITNKRLAVKLILNTVSNMFCLICVKAEWLSSVREML